MVAHNRILVSNYQRILEVYSDEAFTEAVFPYFSTQMNLKKTQEKITKELRSIEPDRAVFVPIENLMQAFQKYFGDEVTYRLHFDIVKQQYLKQLKVTYSAGMEIDVQQFFGVMKDIYMLAAEKRLLRAVILLSFVSNNTITFQVGDTKKRFDEIDALIA